MVTRSNPNRLQTLHYLLFYSIYSCFSFSVSMAAGDALIAGESIGITETLVSSGGEFELGFFSPAYSSTYFVGIWYKKISQRTVVWIMNRDFACMTATPVLNLRPDGNLVIIEGRITYSATNISSSELINATAKLLDTGNFVIAQNGVVLWQSFDYPTHTLLPGMKLGFDRRTGKTWSLNSWRSSIDPFPGTFTMQVDPNRSSEIIINQGSRKYWTSGPWNGETFSLVPRWALRNLKNISYFSDEERSYFVFSGYDSGSIARISLDVSGQIKEFTWSEKTDSWNLNWSQPVRQCEVYAYCGSFAICDQNSSLFCHCFPGFVPQSPRRWDSGDKSGGCFRKAPLECERRSNESDKQDGFLTLSNVILPVDPTKIKAKNSFSCEMICLNNCSCSGYAYNSEGCLIWSGDLFNLQQISSGKSFNLKLSPLELHKTGPKHKPWVWAVLALSLVFFLLAVACIAFLVWKRRLVQGKDLLMFDFDTELGEDVAESNHLVKDKQKDMEMPLFSFASVAAATENFSAANKLGEGGFGPVYLGKLGKGQEVAVKRLSRKSGQGWEELRTEATLIAKLQHRNLVRLLGCCLEREEKILIYEYLSNKSLDFVLFDAGRRSLLDWEKRFRIINGISQGLLYLHEYSRLKIIHRDLKASNILLDKDMNPKISDFGMARIFGGDESQATNRIVGTYGYMSPEYAMDGLFSVKSDVFSFGVLLLEILSGRKNTGLYYSDSLNLLGHAWDMWRKGKELELIDPIMEGSCLSARQVRYINVALLCVQENAADRPSISDIVSMLCNESQPILMPKLPTSSILRSIMDSDSSGSVVVETRSQVEITAITTGR